MTQSAMFADLPRYKTGAVISDDGLYRYVLWRIWGDGPLLLVVMLNPSKADAETNDPTITRVVAFARREGYGGIIVVNLYGYRATKPSDMRRVSDPVGPENDYHIEAGAAASAAILLAWGRQAEKHYARKAAVKRLLRMGGTETPWHCLGWTKGGDPRHPLMVRADQPFEEAR